MFFLVYKNKDKILIKSFIYYKELLNFVDIENISVIDYSIFQGECIKEFY